jgi:type IV pilus assembly protein PilQ
MWKFNLRIPVVVLSLLVQSALGIGPEIAPVHIGKNELISLQFHQIEVTELLQVLAKIGKTNFLLSEAIQGKISVDLQIPHGKQHCTLFLLAGD